MVRAGHKTKEQRAYTKRSLKADIRSAKRMQSRASKLGQKYDIRRTKKMVKGIWKHGKGADGK